MDDKLVSLASSVILATILSGILTVKIIRNGEFEMIRPIGDRVLVERIEEVKKSAGGIIIPENNLEKPVIGEVVAIGEGRYLENGKREALSVRVLDKVIFGKYAGTSVKHEDKEYLMLKEEEILGVIEE